MGLKKSSKRNLPFYDLETIQKDGTWHLLNAFTFAHRFCVVHSRINREKTRWEYMLGAKNDHGIIRHLNPNRLVTASPCIDVWVELMVGGGVLKTKPQDSSQWAFTINEFKDPAHIYPTAVLRNRGAKEICIDSEADLASDSFCFFDISFSGTRSNFQYASLLEVLDDSFSLPEWSPSVQLKLAAWSGKPDAVATAIDIGASPQDCIGPFGLTALHINAREGRKDVVRTLLEKGANPSAVDNYGDNPLHLAAAKGHADVCAILAKKVDLDARNANGETPLDRALLTPQNNVVALLRALAVRAASEAALHEIEPPKPR